MKQQARVGSKTFTFCPSRVATWGSAVANATERQQQARKSTDVMSDVRKQVDKIFFFICWGILIFDIPGTWEEKKIKTTFIHFM
tara:strand:- start:46 stop:297 length:252 start_codon:yes stop_codon:yes gene_type:complete